MCGLETACDQIKHIEINYDALTKMVKLHAGKTRTGRMHVVCQYDTFLKRFSLILIF